MGCPSRRRAALLAAFAATALVASSAPAERAQRGNLIVEINGGISPRKLPRDHRGPVSVHIEGGVQTADESPLPRVNRLRLELAWRGRLNSRGLAVCPRGRLDGIDSREAIQACAASFVGRGRLRAKIFLPNHKPFGVRANLLAFNGRTKVKRRAVLIHAYTSDPPVSFVIPFVVKRQPGAFRTVLVATIRRAVGTWPHVGSFEIDIGRSFMHRGKRRSYLNASCPIPSNFTAGFLSFARATYFFADGRQLKVESVRSCRARKSG